MNSPAATAVGVLIDLELCQDLQEPPWYREVRAHILSLASLTDGWDGEAAPAPNAEARSTAIQVIERLGLMSSCSVRVHAAVDGGVVVVVRRGRLRVSFLADNDDELVIGGSDGAGQPWSEVYRGDADGVEHAVERAMNFLSADA